MNAAGSTQWIPETLGASESTAARSDVKSAWFTASPLTLESLRAGALSKRSTLSVLTVFEARWLRAGVGFGLDIGKGERVVDERMVGMGYPRGALLIYCAALETECLADALQFLYRGKWVIVASN